MWIPGLKGFKETRLDFTSNFLSQNNAKPRISAKIKVYGINWLNNWLKLVLNYFDVTLKHEVHVQMTGLPLHQ